MDRGEAPNLQRAMDQLALTPATRHFLWTELTAPHRHYHGVRHHEMLLASLYAEPDGHMDALIAAGLFHDIVYDPMAQDNEARSVDAMRHWLTGSSFDLDRIAEYIMATCGHTLKPDAPVGTAHLLKADLAVLSADPETYLWYANGVRREYHAVENAAYRAGREKVLRALSHSDFVTQPSNLEWEIALLKAGYFDL